MTFNHASRHRALALRTARRLTMLALCLLAGCRVLGPGWSPPPGHTTIALWPHRPPHAPLIALPEVNRTTSNDELVAGRQVVRIYHVSNPTLTLYEPVSPRTGAAVLVLPGGGFYMLAMDIEGTEICDWLSARGIACALLKYRVPHAGPYPASASGLEDAQRAMGLLRAHAAQWHIDPARIGILGFSAAGHIAAALSTHFDHRVYEPIDAADRQSCRPNFAALVYPGYLTVPGQPLQPNPSLQPTPATPPTLIVQAEDDPIGVDNSTTYFLALKRAHVPAELHIYPTGGHGYGLRPAAAPVSAWPQAMLTWLHTIHAFPQ